MTKGDVVRATHGHDKGGIFMVLEVDGDYVMLANGRQRRVDKPKRKKCKHAQKVGAVTLDNVTNKSLWKALAAFREG